jgi:hypothetical protein
VAATGTPNARVVCVNKEKPGVVFVSEPSLALERSLVISDQEVFWIQAHQLLKAPTRGGPAIKLATIDSGFHPQLLGRMGDALLIIADDLYSAKILQVALVGGKTSAIGQVDETIYCAALSGTTLYAGTGRPKMGDLFGHSGAIGSIYRVALSQHKQEKIAEGFDSCLDMAVSDEEVFIASYGGIYKTPTRRLTR